MVRLGIIISFFAVSAFSADANLIQKSVIKIVSKVEGSAAEFRGTGLLFNKDGIRYVLTSDHVSAHDKGNWAVTEGTNSITGETVKLKFLAAEWGNGLALLKVEGSQHPEWAIPYSDLQLAPVSKVGDRASLYGYPYESTDLTEETFATILNFEAPVPYFVFVPRLIEFEAAVGEFGMSGGPTFSAEGRFLGVLAYQKLIRFRADNRIYSIPSAVALAWLERYFSAPDKYMSYLSEPWFGQGSSDQLLLTNDGLIYMFKRDTADTFRFGIGRMEHLIFFSDAPTIPYNDKRGFIKWFHQFMKDNPWRPSEYNIIDRSSGKPVIRSIAYPAEVFTAFDRPETSLFLVMGEKHEDRYQRVRPLAARLEKEFKDLESKMKASPEWKAISDDLKSLNAKLASMPPHPQDPGTAGANEFYSADWMAKVFFQIEANQSLPGWKQVASLVPGADTQLLGTLKTLKDALQVVEYNPAP